LRAQGRPLRAIADAVRAKGRGSGSATRAWRASCGRRRERGAVIKRFYGVLVLAAIIPIAVAVVTWLDTGCAPGNC
jgi:hypothetical protein